MAGKYWCFTLNNPTEADKPLDWDVQYVIYQSEKGKEGTPHYQGYLELARISRISALKKIHPTAHWERRKGSQAQAIAYCSKQDETYVAGPWTKGEMAVNNQGRRTDLEQAAELAQTGGIKRVAEEYPVAYVKYHKGLKSLALFSREERARDMARQKFHEAKLYPWQKVLENKLLSTPNDRKIQWYWDSKGNTGKSFMANYLEATKGATVLDCSKKVDLAYMLREHEGPVVLFNIVRSLDEQFMGHVYGLAEAIKDDMVTSTKYEPVRLRLGPQHVIVFANIEPDYTKWSEDRYDVTEIKPNTLDTLSPPPVPRLARQPNNRKCEICDHMDFCTCAQSANP